MTAAQPTYSSKNAIDYLYEAQDELYSSQDEKNGKESDIPLNDVLRFLTFRPFVILKQVSSRRFSERIDPVSFYMSITIRSVRQAQCWNDYTVSRTKDPNKGCQNWGDHCTAFPTVLMAKAPTAVIIVKPNEYCSWNEYLHLSLGLPESTHPVEGAQKFLTVCSSH